MFRRGLIVPEDTAFQKPIQIIGPARSFIKMKALNTTETDSIGIEEIDF
jgi:hypothetical protein